MIRKLKLSTLLLWVVLPFLSFNSYGQDSLIVGEVQETMSQGKQNGFRVVIPKISAKDSEKLWKKFLDEETNASVKKEDNELVVQRTLLKSFQDTLSIYSVFKEFEGNTMLSSFFVGVDSVFIQSSKHESQANSAKLFLHNFAVVAYKQGVSDQLEAENKKLSGLENELKEINSNINNSENEIKRNNREIDRQKIELENLKKQEEFTSGEILRQKQLLIAFNGSAESREIEQKKLKNLEKEKKNIVRETEATHEKVNELEKEIKQLEKTIETNKTETIPLKNEEIRIQNEQILQVENLLKNIR